MAKEVMQVLLKNIAAGSSKSTIFMIIITINKIIFMIIITIMRIIVIIVIIIIMIIIVIIMAEEAVQALLNNGAGSSGAECKAS